MDINSACFKSLHESVSLQSDIDIIQSNGFQGENKGKKIKPKQLKLKLAITIIPTLEITIFEQQAQNQ